jgi:hypothetical protein
MASPKRMHRIMVVAPDKGELYSSSDKWELQDLPG